MDKQRLALVVDDDPATRRLLRLALAPYGFAVEEANNGLEALRALREASPDVVIVDLAMPVMDGWSFLREANPHIPTFVLSVTNPRKAALQFGEGGDALATRRARLAGQVRRALWS